MSVLAAAIVAAACATPQDSAGTAAPSGAVEIESCGKRLAFADAPRRVVALDQSSTETLLALGVGDRVVGTANLKTEVAPEHAEAYAKIPVLSPKVLTAEPLRAANPDLVVASFKELFTADRAGTRDELEQLGVPTFVSAVNCPDGRTEPFERLFRDFTDLGEVLGVPDRAERLVSEQRAIVEQVRAAGERRPEGIEVAWVYSVFNGMPYVAGGTGMADHMSELAGVRNVFADVDQEWPEVSWDELAKREPDVIVVGDLSERGNPGDSAGEKLAMMREHPAVSQLAAVRDGKVVELSGIEMDPSVRTVNALRAFSAGLDEIAARG
ncbi:ABC transporter substrate-binding protein [Saccharothrix coeruleofusca]|uniref:ABC transporter substrate-binding protein n=1 Tax=Saccharothrix coeruleofusca TaxID=33919 RepID=A0A918AP31_9PSEU|nr:ABC transporter substrate-binding protein [Saccharothrix coeruleofusca]MBP2337278.1 iron complex transport system substrate-binding protein [Saccharothrix coeruleofusca]GGP65980.1 ABC transporter substrate-binding protein [Saccharothrix coeruleofusca]